MLGWVGNDQPMQMRETSRGKDKKPYVNNIPKTWSLIILGVALAKTGTKVLFITREMSPDQVLKRTDAVWCAISYNDFNRGQLSIKDETKYREYLNHMAEKEVNFVVELATGGVTNIAALIDKHEPEVVFVDGAYLMTDDEDDDDWRGTMKVWRGMKQICLAKKVPIVATSQSKESEKVTLGKISFSKALANECDVVIALEQDSEMFKMKDMMWKPLKLRDSEMTGYFVTKWDWNHMDYHTTIFEGRFLDKPTAEELPEEIQDIDKKPTNKISKR
jgi:replicative DNA helicase